MSAGEQVQQAVALIAAMETLLQDAEVGHDRRKDPRLPFFRPMVLESSRGELIEGFCRDLSILGMGVLLATPCELGVVTIRVPMNDGDSIHFELDLKWCVPVGLDSYAGGGRLVGVHHPF